MFLKMYLSRFPETVFTRGRLSPILLKCIQLYTRHQSSVRLDIEPNPRIEVGPYFINYLKIGNGPHVVFCYPGIMGCFNLQLHPLIGKFNREKFTFVTWDQPGYGLSRPPNRIFTDDSLSEDTHYLAKFMKELGYRKYSVMGWSGGGCSALLFAIRYPHIIDKLVTWGAFSYVDQQDATNFIRLTNPENQGGKMVDVLIEEYGEKFFQDNFSMWMKLFQRIYTVRGGEFCSRDLHKITAPTLVMQGITDNMIGFKHGTFLRDHIPNARLDAWEKGRHNLHLRYPEKFIETVETFLLS